MEIHDRLTKVALGGEGQQRIARALYELTDRPAAIEDRFANLRASGSTRYWRWRTTRPRWSASSLSGLAG
jgi:hypothetical protein